MIPPGVVEVYEEAADVLKPPPNLSICDWAEAKRIIATESGAFSGRYRSSIAPYQRGMMDAVHIPGVEEIVYFTAAQMGKSLCMENIGGYFMEADPSSIIWMWPTEKVAKEWSIDTLDPLIRETPALAELFLNGSRKSANGALFKKFPGGWISIIGANAAANLRRRRARILVGDEIDAMDLSAEGEGTPIEIVASRSETFWNRLRVLASTCTIKNESLIEARYEISNKQKYFVPCPHCSEAAGELDGFQVLNFRNLVFDREPPHSATVYPCEHCGAALTESDKISFMLPNGVWTAEQPHIVNVQGFWINKLYSPFVTWAQMVAKFLKAERVKREDTEPMKVFVNLDLAQTWEERDEDIDKEGLAKRCESYPPPAIPDGVIVLTAGCDVQEDRILCEVVGWGRGFPNPESWSVDWRQFDGDTAKPEVWAKLDEFLATEFLHARGVRLEIAGTFVDSGFHANEVYGFTKPRWRRRIFASKGSSDFKHVPLGRMNRSNKQRAPLYIVGVSQIKLSVYRWLKVQSAGPGYMHFSHAHNDADYFNQLTCEVLKKDYKNGFPVKYWEKPNGARNEALDCRVLAYGALLSLSEKDVGKMIERLRESLMEQARKLAEQRRAKVDPNQLALLDIGKEMAEQEKKNEVAAKIVEVIAPAIGQDVEQMKAAVVEPGLGKNEYKVAAKLDEEKKPELEPPPATPKIRVRRGGWL